MKIEDVICDQCGARKNRENDWYRVQSGREGFHLYKSKAKVCDNVNKDYCSDNCAMIALDNFLHPPKVQEDHYREVGMSNG